jgi:hypothetical protein
MFKFIAEWMGIISFLVIAGAVVLAIFVYKVKQNGSWK